MKKLIILLFFPLMTLKAQTIVTLPLPNPCSVTSSQQLDAEETKALDIKVSPNPNAGIFTLEIHAKQSLGKTIYQISDIKGKSLLNEELYVTHQNLVKSLDISHLPNGIYLLTVTAGKEQKSIKLVLHKNN